MLNRKSKKQAKSKKSIKIKKKKSDMQLKFQRKNKKNKSIREQIQEKDKVAELNKSGSISEIDKAQKQNKYLYVYGLVNEDKNKLDIKGLNNEPIKKLNFQDITALTSPYPTLHPMIKEDEVMQHSNILKDIAVKTTIIPMAFGTVFKDETILKTVLSTSYQAIKKTLNLIEGKIELGVKLVKTQSEKEYNGAAQDIFNNLNQLSIKNMKGDNFSERLLLNYSFLVDRHKFSEFSDKITKLENRYKDLKFLYTGPWPPYSFVNITIRGS